MIEDSLRPTNPNSLTELVTQTGWVFTSRALAMLAGWLLIVLIGNVFGVEALGSYMLAITIFMVARIISTFGIPASLVKHTAEHRDDPEILAGYYSAALLNVSMTTAAGACILFLGRPLIAALLGQPELAGYLTIVALGIPLFGVNTVILARLNGLREMKLYGLGESLRHWVLLGLTACYALSQQPKLESAIWMIPAAECLLLPVLWVATKSHRYLSLSALGKRCRTLGVWGGQVVLSRVITELDSRLALFFVAAFLTRRDVGLFSVALAFAAAVDILPLVAQRVTGPAMTEMYAKKQIASMTKLVKETMSGGALGLALMAVAMVLFFPQIIAVVYPQNPEFLHAETPLAVMLLGRVFRGTAVSVGPIFMSANRPDLLFKTALARLPVTCIVTWLAIGAWGLNGAAVGAATSDLLIFGMWTALIPMVVGIPVAHRPLLAIPLFAVLVVIFADIIPDSTMGMVGRALLLIAFAIVGLRAWHFDRYIRQLYREAVQRRAGS
jgi:O-antigen/teichoic acid export membrane protein